MGKKVQQCISCDGDSFALYCPELIKCRNCGLVSAAELPTPGEVHDLYQKDYFFGMEYSDYEADRPALEGNFRRRIRRLSDFIKPSANVVEIGCAYGYFLNLIKDRVGQHAGFDVSEDGIRYATDVLGLHAYTEDFLDHKFADKSVDLVVMWDVMEHLVEPARYVERVSRILKPGGALVFTTGDVSALVPRLRKDKWRMIHPPTHVYYFDPKTAGLLLRKHGLQVKNVRYKSVSRNVGSVANQIICNQKAAGKSTALLDAGLKMAQQLRMSRLNLPANMWDIMEVVAVKQ